MSIILMNNQISNQRNWKSCNQVKIEKFGGDIMLDDDLGNSDQITIFVIESCDEIQNKIHEEKYIFENINEIKEAISIGCKSDSEWNIE